VDVLTLVGADGDCRNVIYAWSHLHGPMSISHYSFWFTPSLCQQLVSKEIEFSENRTWLFKGEFFYPSENVTFTYAIIIFYYEKWWR
jgi:hypothetical protein